MKTVKEMKAFIKVNKNKSFHKLYNDMNIEKVLIIRDNRAGFLIKLEDEVYVHWQHNGKLNRLHYRDVNSLKECIDYHKRMNKIQEANLAREALQQVLERNKIRYMLDKNN